MRVLKELNEKIIAWHHARNLIHGSSDKQQFKKLLEELMEMHDSIVLGDSPIDDIGDMYVVLCNLAERNGLTMKDCAESSQFYILEERDFNASFDSIQADVMRLRESIVLNTSLKSDIGDVAIELTRFATVHNLNFEECVAHAWNDIKDRTGQMVDGIYVKDAPQHNLDYTLMADSMHNQKGRFNRASTPKSTEFLHADEASGD